MSDSLDSSDQPTYCIRGLCHRTDLTMGAHGFCIDLAPGFAQAVKLSGLTQQNINNILNSHGQHWLNAAGYDEIWDPDNCGAWKDEKLPPGPNARPLYRPHDGLSVAWGAWGPEHISVPGNACGLDIDHSSLCCCIFKGGRQLQPHNVDCWQQKYLMLITFTELAEHVCWAARKLS